VCAVVAEVGGGVAGDLDVSGEEGHFGLHGEGGAGVVLDGGEVLVGEGGVDRDGSAGYCGDVLCLRLGVIETGSCDCDCFADFPVYILGYSEGGVARLDGSG
jgi:hypothetical protein